MKFQNMEIQKGINKIIPPPEKALLFTDVFLASRMVICFPMW